MLRYNVFACAVIFLAACTGDKAVEVPRAPSGPIAPSQAQIDYAEFAEPDDAYLAEIYNRSCISCHSVDGAGAPLTGHSIEWNRRMKLRGEDGLMASTVNGLEGMPAMGMCADCSEDDFKILISFMMTEK